MGWFRNLIDRLFDCSYPREPELELSPRGECMLEYCRRRIAGEQVYIQSYEDELLEFAEKHKLDIDTAIKVYAEVLEQISREGTI